MTLKLTNLPEELQRKIERRAQAENLPLDQAALQMLSEAPEPPPVAEQKVIGNGLDWFFGSGALEPEVLKAIAEHDVIVSDE